MKKILYCAALLFSVYGCNDTQNDINTLNVFFTDLSKVYTPDFDGPDADDVIKIDFAVKKMFLDSPEMFEATGKNTFAVDSAKVNETIRNYFSSPVKKPSNTVDVDFTKDGRYEIIKFTAAESVYSEVGKIAAERNDTLLLEIDVYSGINNSGVAVNSTLYKKMRAVVTRKDGGFRVLSYKTVK